MNLLFVIYPIWNTINKLFSSLFVLFTMQIFPRKRETRFPKFLTLLCCVCSGLLIYAVDALIPLLSPALDASTAGTYLRISVISVAVIGAFSLFLYQGSTFLILLTDILFYNVFSAVRFFFLGLIYFLLPQPPDAYIWILGEFPAMLLCLVISLLIQKRVGLALSGLSRKEEILWMTACIIDLVLLCELMDLTYRNGSAMLLASLSLIFTTLAIYVLIFRYSSEKYRTLEQERLLRSVDASKNYIAQLKESTAQLSQTRHELKNHVFYLEELIRQGKKAELLGYLENLKVQYAETEGIIYTGNRLIDAILNQKQAFAESLGIPTSFSTQVPEDIQFNDLTLCSVLGNLIDNAIEASVNEKRPAITADLHLYKDYLIITVENDVSYNVLEKNPQLHTTKKDADRHGIGIHAVQELLEKEGGIFLTEMADEHTFRVSAMLPCSVKLPGKEN